MWKPIEIKPNDQSVIGRKIRCRGCLPGIVAWIGNSRLILRDEKDEEEEIPYNLCGYWDEWIPDEPKEEVRLVSPWCIDANDPFNPARWKSVLPSPARVVLKNVTWKSSNDLSADLFFEVKQEVKF